MRASDLRSLVGLSVLAAGAFEPGAPRAFGDEHAAPPAYHVYEWTFDGGNLSPAIGNGVLEFADGLTASSTRFGVTEGIIVPNLNGQAGSYMHVPAFTGLGNGYLASLNDSGPNGGGEYINRYSILMDVLLPGSVGWTALFNTNPENSNDADWYVASDESLGIADLGYSSAGLVTPNTWNRIAF